ncbi:MAG: S24/S26 family peptidase [Clostridia bacterium]|nr:S24/S26 family peptidase [Clostridia bacterium]
MENISAVSLGEAMPIMLDMLKNGNMVSLVVKGGSMYPFLISGRDKVLLSSVNKPVKRGDIVLYKTRTDKYVLHRVSRVDNNGNLEIIGDGQLVADYPVQPDAVVAVACRVIRKGKEINRRSIRWMMFSNPLFLKFSRKYFVKRAIKKGSEADD